MERARLLGRQTTTARAPERAGKKVRVSGAAKVHWGPARRKMGKFSESRRKMSRQKKVTPVYHSRVTRRDDIFHSCPATPESPPFPFTPAKRHPGSSRV